MPDEIARISKGASARRPRKKRRWRDTVVRAAVMTVTLLAVAYATLPWWIPKSFLADRIERTLSARLGVPVSIGRLEVSWGEGISIRDIRIGNPSGFGAGAEMVSIGTFRCDLSPIRLLLKGRLRWIELSEARLRVVVGRDGRMNVAHLGPLVESPPPDRLVVRDAGVTLRLPRNDRLLRLDVADLQYNAGRLEKVGQIVMSAAFAQAGRAAPVTLIGSVGGDNPTTPAAACSFRFDGVDISQLNLPKVMNLPLKRLAGRASGQIDCRVNDSGRVEEFSLAISVDDLDAQPRTGPKIPVIRRAEIYLGAALDLVNNSIDAHEFRLRLPGINLQGKGRIHADALAGRWEAVRSLNITGLVNPATVAALLADRAQSPDRVEVSGDVKVAVSLHGDASQLSFNAVVDATDAAVRAGFRLAKPGGRKLTALLDGKLEKNTWRFSAERAELRIGPNRFTGGGTIRNTRRALSGQFRQGLGDLDWEGSWRVVDLESISRMLDGVSRGRWSVPRGVSLEGVIEGKWSLRSASAGQETVFDLRSVHLPAGTRLVVGKWFVKPPEIPMDIELAATITTDPPGLSRFRLWAGLGSAGVSVQAGRLTLLPADPDKSGRAQAIALVAQGRYAVQNIGELLACIPDETGTNPSKSRRWKERFDGSLTGRFDLMLSPSFRRLHTETNATQLKADFGPAFLKAEGQPAEITLDLRSDDSLSPAARNRLSLLVRLGAAELDGSVTFPAAGVAAPTIRCRGRLTVADAAWLGQRIPALGRRFEEYDVDGSLTASVQAEISDSLLVGQLICDADDMGFGLPGPAGRNPRRIKPRGAALRLRLAARIDRQNARLDALSIDVGRSSVSITGNAGLAGAGGASPSETYWPPPGLANVDLDIRGRLVLDSTARGLLPELDEFSTRYGVGGLLRFDTRIRGDATMIDASGNLDAVDVSVGYRGPGDARGWQVSDATGLKGRIVKAAREIAGAFDKPAGAAAKVGFELSLPSNLSRLDLRDLTVDTGVFWLRADGTVPLLGGGKQPAVQPEAHVLVSADDLRKLPAFLPELASYEPSGSLRIEGRFRREKSRDILEYVTVQAGDAAATVGGKRCGVDGTVLLEDVAIRPSLPAERGTFTVGRIATDSLELSIGRNRGFLVANVLNPAKGPAGEVTLLCDTLDVHELQRWANPEATTAGPVNADAAPLTPEEIETLASRARDVIARLREACSSANLRCRVRIGRLRYFDPKVRAFYEPQVLVADIVVKDGRVDAGYRAGLNGGIMRQRYSFDLDAPEPRLTLNADLRELLTGENILAQVAREFPGNTFYGTFSQAKNLTYPLGGLVMNYLDGRYRAIPVGTARTEAVEGIVKGRAAPMFVTRFFPGLNLASYQYRRMTGFADHLRDGTTLNDMIFSGPVYDLYMEGSTDPENVARYTIGVILLGTPQSPQFNHRFRQGRIPILKFKARIAGGRFHDEVVSYPWPTETAYKIFLENNIFYRLWLAASKKPNDPVAAEEPTGPGRRQ